jgi:hypothetical protein
MTRSALLLSSAAALFALSGGLASAAILGTRGSPAPTRTITIHISTGERGPIGPPGPRGPAGPAGSFECPSGFSIGELVIDHPGGHVTLYGCLK